MKRGAIVAVVLVVVLVLGLTGFYVARNPEREVLDDAARSTTLGSFVRLSNGVTHYELRGPATARTVVLVHGFSVPYYIWDSTTAALEANGFRVLRYDEFGRGFSDRPDVAYDASLYDRQLAELLDSLHVPGKVDLAGVSMGGWVTATFTGRHPERVRTLTLVDPVAGSSPAAGGAEALPIVGPYLFQALAVPGMADGQAGDFVNPGRFPEWAERYRPQMRYKGFGRALLSTRRATAGMNTDTLYARVSATGVPVLLLWGQSDATVPFERNARVRQAIPAAEFHAIAGAGHLPIVEQATLTDSLIVGFLRRK